jgi:hypothetical protein
MNRQKDDLIRRLVVRSWGYCLPFEKRRRDIGHQQIGIETPRFQYSMLSIPYGTNDVKLLASTTRTRARMVS